MIEAPVARMILSGEVGEGDEVAARANAGEIRFDRGVATAAE